MSPRTGRPPGKPEERMRLVALRLAPADHDALLEIGEGKLAKGVRKLLKREREQEMKIDTELKAKMDFLLGVLAREIGAERMADIIERSQLPVWVGWTPQGVMTMHPAPGGVNTVHIAID